MITITNLNKFYTTKQSMHHALKDINLELPDRGIVFVLGKSGSGKSTLLNLIGGLDNVSSGSISVDGNVISEFDEDEFVHYRNSCVGFVFQDHHLIDDLTLYENIKLALDLRHIRDTSLISHALEQVGLGGYEGRYPHELSGGERQRVAIARAIVKRPRIILADEPTGNLDGVNAAEIMRILRELARDCLVLTVSHNTAEVLSNADRIIELSAGQIVSDVTRNPDYREDVFLREDTVCFPGDRPLNQQDVGYINDQLSMRQVRRFAISGDKFGATKPSGLKERDLPIEKSGLSIFQLISLSMTFLKSKVGRIFSVAIPLSLILLIILLSQTYINFDGNRIIADRMEIAGQTSIVLSKEISLDGVEKNARRYPAIVTKDDLKAFLATGYQGKTYPILSVSVPVTGHKNASGIKSTAFSYGVVATESLGTIVVDENFFVEKLGSLEFVANVRKEKPLGVYITDYLADCILNTNSNYKGGTYSSLLGEYQPYSNELGSIYINGIIATGYRTRYEDLINRVTAEKETDIAVLYNDPEFQKMSSELYTFLAYSYTFNENYAADFAEAETTYLWSHRISLDGKSPYTIADGFVSYDPDTTLTGNQVKMGLKMYNAIFGTNYKASDIASFQAHSAKLTQYAYYDTENSAPLMECQVQIVGLYEGDGMRISYDIRQQFAANHVRQTGIYFNSLSHLGDILDVAQERSFIQDSITLEGILTLSRCVMLFIFIFRMVNVILCAAVVFIFISFATKMISDKLHEIGIMKALGTGRKAISFIFGLQIGLIALVTCVASVLGYYFLIEPANDLFIISLREMVPSQLVLDLDVLVFIPQVAVENVLLIVVLAIISLVVPMSRIGKIQPVKIINNRE